MLTSILDIIDVGANLLLDHERDAIQSRVLFLRNEYAHEINQDIDNIDDAKLFSLKLELRNLISVYNTAVQKQVLLAGTKPTR